MSATTTTLEAPVLVANDETTTTHAPLTTSPATVASLFDLKISKPFTITHSFTDGTHKFKVEPEETQQDETEEPRSWLKFFGEHVNTVANMHQVPLYGLGINYATTKDAHEFATSVFDKSAGSHLKDHWDGATSLAKSGWEWSKDAASELVQTWKQWGEPAVGDLSQAWTAVPTSAKFAATALAVTPLAYYGYKAWRGDTPPSETRPAQSESRDMRSVEHTNKIAFPAQGDPLRSSKKRSDPVPMIDSEDSVQTTLNPSSDASGATETASSNQATTINGGLI